MSVWRDHISPDRPALSYIIARYILRTTYLVRV